MTYEEAKEKGLYDSSKNGTILDYKEGEKYYLLPKGYSFEYTKVLRNPDIGEWVNFRFTITGINLDPGRKR